MAGGGEVVGKTFSRDEWLTDRDDPLAPVESVTVSSGGVTRSARRRPGTTALAATVPGDRRAKEISMSVQRA
jgi:hypothetical protein